MQWKDLSLEQRRIILHHFHAINIETGEKFKEKSGECIIDLTGRLSVRAKLLYGIPLIEEHQWIYMRSNSSKKLAREDLKDAVPKESICAQHRKWGKRQG